MRLRDTWLRTSPAEGSAGEPQLTARESEIVDLVIAGCRNREISERLSISEKTVKAHLTRIFAELGVTDRTQAALWAQRNLAS